ncbi:Lipid-A-disaccharide synthase [Candidatus Trichorickettsia mobilis]|uniref:Lipid-A-disaccharide synthase n=1 Tax=Candidatus Trichorickettsia mobilis TaxID=1346319 RepID=A0ABZ0US92_9RICK|nr:lipid-A-disaccharide synthase [Candidatus Trichorickettsia mobilis]WPY00888.1 Lipid-A-disaccharide synthase [Candidatus Trichorickettsia mobilis]
MTNIYIIAGEPSGDFIGSRVMFNLKSLQPALNFIGVGGKLMSEQGLHSLFPLNEISIMGFWEIIPHIPRLKKLIQHTAEDIINQAPDILITIDSPGFTYRVAQKVRAKMPYLKMLHIVAPSVWVYKPGRAKKYAKLYNHLLALLPFEPPYFEAVGLPCSYIGHPVTEQDFYSAKTELQAKENIPIPPAHKIICVTAGSRVGEIARHTPVFCQALNIVSKFYPDLQALFVINDPSHQTLITRLLTGANFDFKFSLDRLKSFALADVALAKSGTNTLEIAASSTPMIVAYKINIMSYVFIKLLIKIKYISLINIIPNQKILPEFIQSDCNPKSIANEIINILANPNVATQQLQASNQVLNILGFNSNNQPSMRAANIILELLAKNEL